MACVVSFFLFLALLLDHFLITDTISIGKRRVGVYV